MSTSTRIWSFTGACLILAAALFASGARAQFYIGAEGGWTALPDQTDTIPGVPSATARFHGGFNAGARVGYEWGPWRFEEEYSYRQNSARSLTVGGLTINGVGGSRHSN